MYSEVMTWTDRKADGPIAAGVMLIVVVLAERSVLWAAGIRFNTESLSWYWQVLDPQLLHDRLLESLFYLHAQPPAFNALIGLALKLGPAPGLVALRAAFVLMSLALALLLFAGLVEVGWKPRSAAAVVALLALSPGWICYEHWLFYDFPTVVMLAAAAVAIVRWGATRSTVALGFFVASVTGLALTRSVFHLVWVAGSLGVVAPAAGKFNRRVAVVLLAPMVLVGGWYAKNEVVFGFFGSSSWLGMSLSKMTTARLLPEEREPLIAEGTISPMARVRPFSPLQDFEIEAGVRFQDSPPQVLGQRIKSTGAPNFNHRGFLEVSRQCRADALAVIRRSPAIYGRSVAIAVRRFLTSGVAYPPFRENLMVMAPVFVAGEASWSHPATITLAFGAALLFASWMGVRAWRSGDRSRSAAYCWIGLTMLWTLVVGSLAEVGENHRFRFVLSPLIWLMLADAGRRVAVRFRD